MSMKEGGNKSESYEPCEQCNGADCSRLDENTKEEPCWGKVEIGAVDDYGDGNIFIHECQGHKGLYYSFDDDPEDRDYAYKHENAQ